MVNELWRNNKRSADCCSLKTRSAASHIGELLVNSAITRDYPVLQFGVITVAFAVVCITALTDIAYAFADPRIRLAKG